MEDNFLINKFLEDLTPRRAIAKFAVIATPIESPDPSTLFQLPQVRFKLLFNVHILFVISLLDMVSFNCTEEASFEEI